VLNTLDLSLCQIGDTGAQALALAIAYNPGCIRSLDLSNNCLSDDGAIALAYALRANTPPTHRAKVPPHSDGNGTPPAVPSYHVDTIDLSGNAKIGDEAASELATTIECGAVRCVSLRSCSLTSDGASAIGTSLGRIAKIHPLFQIEIEIDLSGNRLGGYETKTKSGGRYSAGALTSRASATTASYMSFIGKKFKDVSGIGGGEADGSDGGSDTDGEDGYRDILRVGRTQSGGSGCGVTSLCNAVIEEIEGDDNGGEEIHHQDRDTPPLTIKLGLRMCNLDEKGANALAAAIISLRDNRGVRLSVDAGMNAGIGSAAKDALAAKYDDGDEILRRMAEQHFEELEAAREALRLVEESEDVLRWGEDDDDDDGFSEEDESSDFERLLGGSTTDSESDGYNYDT